MVGRKGGAVPGACHFLGFLEGQEAVVSGVPPQCRPCPAPRRSAGGWAMGVVLWGPRGSFGGARLGESSAGKTWDWSASSYCRRQQNRHAPAAAGRAPGPGARAGALRPPPP